MSNLSMVEAKLPPGFRFHPRDEELICDYLMKKMTSSESCPFLIEVDLNKCEPWDIPVSACVGGKEWYFYSQRDRKYATGLRTNRATISGYWKATGKDRLIVRRGTLVGMRKTLVFYQGRAPKGRKTEWVMHEFRLEGPLGPPKIPSSKDDWVLCRVFYKSKEAAAKQGMRLSSSYDDTISSSSLPPLMDSYITFDQTLPNQSHHSNSHNQEHDHEHVDDDHNQLANPSTNQDQYEQVPCFSNFTQNQISQTFSHITHMDPNMSIPSTTTTTTKSSVTSAPTFGGLPQFVSSSSCLTPLISSSCDKKVLQAVLNHFTKLETINNNNNNNSNLMMIKGGSPGFGDGISDSDQNFLSDVVLPTSIWNNHY